MIAEKLIKIFSITTEQNPCTNSLLRQSDQQYKKNKLLIKNKGLSLRRNAYAYMSDMEQQENSKHWTFRIIQHIYEKGGKIINFT